MRLEGSRVSTRRSRLSRLPQSYRTLEVRALGLIDDTHAALAEFPFDLVVADGPFDHGRLDCTALGIRGGRVIY